MLQKLKESINNIYGEDLIFENSSLIDDELKEDIVSGSQNSPVADKEDFEEDERQLNHIIDDLSESEYEEAIDRIIDNEMENEDDDDETGLYTNETEDSDEVFDESWFLNQ